MSVGDSLYWIWLSEVLGQACSDFPKLLEQCNSVYEIYRMDDSEIEHLTDIGEKTREAIANKNLQRATDILESCERLGIKLLTFSDPAFPHSLTVIKNPPVLLYYKGTLPDFSWALSVAMVGTRHMSAYGMACAYKIAYELATAKAVVVSGMATGIDGVSAAAAIQAGGSTVAVLGCGVDVIYPRHHARLWEMIIQNGAVMSEYPPGTSPTSYHFPVRNRLISGLAQATVVVEAGEKSGSFITADEADKQGKPVFAVPANTKGEGAAGCNRLLREGARVATCGYDVLVPFRFRYKRSLPVFSSEALPKAPRTDVLFLESLGVMNVTENLKRKAEKAILPDEADGKVMPDRENNVCTPSPAPKVKREKKSSQKETGEHRREEPQAQQTPDEFLSSLTEMQRLVFEAMPDDRSVTADALSGLDLPSSEIIATLTMLEILGLVQKLPGALYMKI